MSERSTAHLWLGTILFVLILPGTVMVYVPYALTGFRLGDPFLGSALTRVPGALLIVAGLPIFLEFLWRFVQQGHGTPAPVAAPTELVVEGVFRYSRNPGYVAVVAILVGEALILGSAALLAWAAAIFVTFHLFVIFYEEPSLRRQFGDAYDAYRRRTPRWLGRARP